MVARGALIWQTAQLFLIRRRDQHDQPVHGEHEQHDGHVHDRHGGPV
jgi:hypothetical protein